MKHTIAKSAITSVVAAALLVISAPLSSHANSIKTKEKTGVSTEKTFVQYTGSNSSSFVFRVKFENPTAEKFTLIVKNDDGDVVYEGQYNDVHFDKAVYLPNDVNEIRPTFAIRTSTKQVENSFLVNKKLTENVVVTKL